jgi:hypothetical protein
MHAGVHSHQIGDVAQEASLGYVTPRKQRSNQTSERFQFSLAPTQQTNASGAYNAADWQSASTNAQNQNVYTPGQSSLLGGTVGGYGNLLAGNVPTSFTQNPQLLQSYNTAFNQAAPSLSFQGGAGSPQMQSNYALGLSSLLGNQYNTGISNYLGALGGASNTSLSPVGANATGYTGTTNYQTGYGNSNQTISQPISLVNLLSALGGTL